MSDLRLSSHRLDMRLSQPDGHAARLVIPLPSSGEPQYWIYATPVDADDWVQQLLIWIDEEVDTLGLVSGRVRTDYEGESYVEATPYGWRVSDPSINEADGTAVLGFVERSGSGFAVLPLDDPAGVRTFDDFSTAVESLASRCRSAR